MQLSSLSTSIPNGRYKERRAALRTIGAATSSVHFPVESRDIPAISQVSAAGVNNVSYIYKPVADLLGLIADSDPIFGGGGDASSAPDFLGDLSWLFSSRDAADAAAPAGASAGSGSVLAANAAYEISMHLADEET
jgi:hypothetical protein